MNIADYLKNTTDLLESNNINTARLDSLILMEFVLGVDRAKLLAEPNEVITSKQIKVLNRLISKRTKHMPIAYITHQTEFYGRSFYINSHVLEPRPESETMIDMLKGIVSDSPYLTKLPELYIADVGTGCGALGITAAIECSKVRLELIDIDDKALEVAKNNVVLHTIKARLRRNDLLSRNQTAYHILLCNLPYVPDDFSINLAAGHEPRIAIFGGKDGLDIYRKLFKTLTYRQHKPLYILTEALPPSHISMTTIAKAAGYRLQESRDFIQLFTIDKS